MPQITLRLEQDLLDKIELKKGEKDRSAFLRDVIVSYFDSHGNADEMHESQENANTSHLHDEIAFLRKKLDDITALHEKAIASHNQEKNELMRLMSQEQSLHLQTQRLLPENTDRKPWWQFWK
jgi:metal-responsive CopG/Arc/MetJ family transcriptional regulator